MRPLEVALHLRRTQEALDALRFAEPLVDPEADVGGEFQVHAMRDLAAQKTHLDRLAAGLKNVTTTAVIGLAADEIVTQAQEHGAELIVLGSHGHGALYHLFAGSVVTGVLKRARIPVLVVPTVK